MADRKQEMAVRIKEAREWKGLTQVYMAQQLRVARQTYLDLETEKLSLKYGYWLRFLSSQKGH